MADVQIEDYDFLDFGAGTGESLARFEQRFGGRGLGIDIDERKVDEASRHGRDVVLGDLLSVPGRDLVRYVTMDNVLEHLPSWDYVYEVLATAVRIAREFIYIRHPSFEDEAYLRALGLKQYWTDWTGHPSHILLSQFVEMFRRLDLGLWEVRFIAPVMDSMDPTILPTAAPPDQHRYSTDAHGPKPLVRFEKPVFGAIDFFVPVHTLGNRLILKGDPADDRPLLAEPSSLLVHLTGDVQRRVVELQTRCADYQDQLRRLQGRRAIRVADSLGQLARARSLLGLRTSLKGLVNAFRKTRG